MQQESTGISRWRARVGTTLAALLVGWGMQSPALAKKDIRDKAGEPPLLVQRDGARTHAGKSLDRIIEAAEKRHRPARVRRVEESTVKGRLVYVLRMQKDGKVWEIKVDAETEKEL
jgi:uncharacterized membrane protein YkoI